MEKFELYNSKGQVEDPKLAEEMAYAQKPYMDEATKTYRKIFRQDKNFREVGEKVAEEVGWQLEGEINERIESEASKKAFEEAREVIFEAGAHSLVYNSEIIVKNGEDEFSFRFPKLVESGYLKPEQLVELFEVKLVKGELKFTDNLKEGWKNKLEQMLNKKIAD